MYAYSGKTHALLWKAAGTFPNGRFGRSIACADDFNSDGVPDLLVGAPLVDKLGVADAGAFYILNGLTGGNLLTHLGNTNSGMLGTSVAAPGDVDGDGRGDLVVGAPGESPGGRLSAGSLFVHSGGSGSLLYRCDGQMPGDLLGTALHAAGNVNGDGIPDFVSGAIAATGGNVPTAGSAFAFSGALLDLNADSTVVSASSGAVVSLCIDCGPAHAGEYYVLGMSVSGSSPPTTIDGVPIPLVFDPVTQVGLRLLNTPAFQNFAGLIPATGAASPTLALPAITAPGLPGTTLYLAAFTVAPVTYASNPLPIRFLP